MIRQNIKIVVLLGLLGRPAAARPFPTCTIEHIQELDRAGECWNRQDVGCTKLILEKVLARQPGCAQGLYLRSFVWESEGRLEEAQALRQRAETLDPKLEEFWRERGKFIEDTQLSGQEFSNFKIRFHGGENRDKAWRAVSYLNEAYNEMGSAFGFFPEKKIEVIVYSGQDFVATWRNPYVGGFFDLLDGKVRVRVDEEFPGGEKEYRRTCRHEFTHAFVFPLMPKKGVPLWFTEGIAEFYAYRDTADSLWKEKKLKEWRDGLKSFPSLSLAQIHEAIEKKRDVRKAVLGYYYAAMFCIQVARERGDSWIPRMVESMRAGRTFDQAFLEVVGVEPGLMYQRFWDRWE